jgi:hypothetical protein
VYLFCLSSSCVPYVVSFSGLFLFCLSSSCVPYVVSFSGLSIFLLPHRYSVTFKIVASIYLIKVNFSLNFLNNLYSNK